jgi:hypothetical protein
MAPQRLAWLSLFWIGVAWLASSSLVAFASPIFYFIQSAMSYRSVTSFLPSPMLIDK